MGKAFVKYSDAEIQKAREADLLEIIARTEGLSFKSNGDGYRCIEHDSLFIKRDRQSWYWNSRSQGGYGPIDWLMLIEGYNFTNAVGYIINKVEDTQQTFNSISSPLPPKADDLSEEKELILPPKTQGKYSNVYAYLTQKRCIAPEIVQYCFKKEILYQDTNRNCVFVGYDEDHIPKFAECRSSAGNVKFRHNVSGSNKEYSFNIRARRECNRVFIFESPIDLLSHANLNCMNVQRLCAEKGFEYDKNCWLNHNRLSLSGTSYDAALDAYLTRYPEIKSIACCLDNDQAGQKTANTIYKTYTKKGYIVTIHRPSIGKDYNDTLVALKGNTQQAVKEQPAIFMLNDQPKR